MNQTTPPPHKLTAWIKKIKTLLQAVFSYLRAFYEKGKLPPIERLSNSRLGKTLTQSRWQKVWASLRKLVEFSLRQWIDHR